MQQPVDSKGALPCRVCGGRKTVVVAGKEVPCSACLGVGKAGYQTK